MQLTRLLRLFFPLRTQFLHNQPHKMFQGVVGQLKVQNVEYISLQLDDILYMPPINPTGEFRRVYFLILHGNKEASLGYAHCFQLILDFQFAAEIQVHIVDSQVQRAPLQMVLPIDFKEMPHQVAPHFGSEHLVITEIGCVDCSQMLALGYVFDDLLFVVLQLMIAPYGRWAQQGWLTLLCLLSAFSLFARLQLFRLFFLVFLVFFLGFGFGVESSRVFVWMRFCQFVLAGFRFVVQGFIFIIMSHMLPVACGDAISVLASQFVHLLALYSKLNCRRQHLDFMHNIWVGLRPINNSYLNLLVMYSI